MGSHGFTCTLYSRPRSLSHLLGKRRRRQAAPPMKTGLTVKQLWAAQIARGQAGPLEPKDISFMSAALARGTGSPRDVATASTVHFATCVQKEHCRQDGRKGLPDTKQEIWKQS
mmetsp:Transcript_129780/g.225547  ORF Transcript_129780/g.225547 Transcript_129780/m.225547 type:complete len:114 (-) Transcript_129780:368-709(-)